MKIYISGLHSGTNPQPGVGIARSVRAGYPGAEIIGVEYSNRSSGIHWTDFDDIWLQRPWAELNLPQYAAQIEKVLDAGGWWISGSDLESLWLADVFSNGHPQLLTPPLAALEQTAKPNIAARGALPIKIPTFVTTELTDWELHAFCREHDWRVWLKGPYYEAIRVRDWGTLEHFRQVLSSGWTTERLFLQAHVSGYEQSISFAAYKGELLECVYMHKRDLTEENKTWAGETSEVSEDFKTKLRQMVKDTNWTGGAELEMVCDPAGQLWLLEINPRFPAWIHGSTLTGKNIPATLIEAASGIKAQKPLTTNRQFSRVILEVPVRARFPLPPLPEPLPAALGHSLKHPAGLTALAEKLHRRNQTAVCAQTQNTASVPAIPTEFLADLEKFDLAEIETPASLFLQQTATDLFQKAAKFAQAASRPNLKIVNAYSIKTNPDARLIKLAKENGFLAEGISPLEIRKALTVGFKPEETILNGPGKWWRQEALPKSALRAIFADSINDLNRIISALQTGTLKAKTVGLRLRTPNVASRFGISIDSPGAFQELVAAVRTLPRENEFGVHFHFASSNIGLGQWWHLFESMLGWSASIERLSGRKIELLDAGGGWFPDDLNRSFTDQMGNVAYRVEEMLPNVRQIVFEPGKALAQPSFAVAMRVLEINGNEVVVDGSIAELPMYFFYPHRIVWQNSRTGVWQPLGRGNTQLFGRLCMEHDVVGTNVGLPAEAEPGDALVFFDAGAYDQSMSYIFGQG